MRGTIPIINVQGCQRAPAKGTEKTNRAKASSSRQSSTLPGQEYRLSTILKQVGWPCRWLLRGNTRRFAASGGTGSAAPKAAIPSKFKQQVASEFVCGESHTTFRRGRRWGEHPRSTSRELRRLSPAPPCDRKHWRIGSGLSAPRCRLSAALDCPGPQSVVAESDIAGHQHVLVPAGKDVRSRGDEEGLDAAAHRNGTFLRATDRLHAAFDASQQTGKFAELTAPFAQLALVNQLRDAAAVADPHQAPGPVAAAAGESPAFL